jgi:putative peptide zinc metalloprotease protein
MSDPLSLPRLHPGISITPFSSGTRDETFLLTCPDGRSLQISAKLRELLAFLDGKSTCTEIARHLSEAWQAPVLETEVRTWLARHLVPRGLLLHTESCPEESAGSPARRPRLPGIPLLSARNLLPFSNLFGGLFRPRVAVPLLWLAALCHLLLYTRLLSGGEPGPPLSPQTCGIGTLVLFLSVLLHELGHLSACRYFLCPHGGIRFGLYLIFPVLYADVTPAWRLHRKARVVVDLGGVYFQLLLTIPLFCLHRGTLSPLWLFLFLELDGLILFAMNPFLRFDGYWVCSDLLGVANLRSRSRRMRRALLQRLSRPRPSSPDPFLELRLPEALGLHLYAAAQCAFFLGVFFSALRYLPHRLILLPNQIEQTFSALARQAAAQSPAGALSSLVSLAFQLVLLVAGTRIAYRLLKGLFVLARRVLRRPDRPAQLHPPRDGV